MMIESVMIKPVGDVCNLRCTYCYYRGKTPTGTVRRLLGPEQVDGMLVNWLGRGPRQITISFQGGEPTLAGLEWFEEFFRSVERHRRNDQQISFALQSNGLQFNLSWAKLFRAHDVLVGLSMDGPKALHDYYRLDARGQGTFERVQQKARLLLDEGIRVNAMVLLNDRNVTDAKLLYAFFRQQGFEWLQFIPCVEWDSEGQLREFCVTGEAYGEFLVDLFEVWYRRDVGKMFVRHFESVLAKQAGVGGGTCYTESYCHPGLTIECDGGVYGCDHFVQEQWRLGSLDDEQLLHWDTHPLYLEFGRNKADLPRACLSCKYLKLCGGGCPKHRSPRDGENVLCAAYKRFLETNLGRIERLARRFVPNMKAAAQDATWGR